MSRGSKPAEKLKELHKWMKQLKVFEKDIKEQFVTSPGPGGQNVNKVATRVVLKHVPTGIVVKCSEKNSQVANRHLARYILVEKIAKRYHEAELLKIKEFERERRRNRKVTKLEKEFMLHDKHFNSDRKKLRKKLRPAEVGADE